MKSEPEEFSISDLKKVHTTLWTGVRNYQARNFMKDQMKLDDKVLFYHSNADPTGVAGLATVSKLGQIDPLQFDCKSEYYDASSTTQNPRWLCVEIKFEKEFEKFISLNKLRSYNEIEDLLLFKRGQRLSIQPLTKKQFDFILNLAR